MQNTKTKRTDVKTVSICGMLCAMAFALTAAAHFLIPPLFPAASFLTFDPKDVVLAIGAMLLGPVPALIVTVIASLLEMATFSSTGWIGFVMNIVASGAFILPGAFLYRRRRTVPGKSACLRLSPRLRLLNCLLRRCFPRFFPQP